MIVPMKRLTLVALRENEEAIIKELQKLSAVEVISTGEAGESPALQKLDREAGRIEQARRALKPYYKKPLLQPPVICTGEELEKGRERAATLCEEIETLDRELSAKRSEAEKRRQTAAGLAPFELLTTPIEDIRPTRNVRYITGVADAQALERVESLPELLDMELLAIEEYPSPAGTGVLIGCFSVSRDGVSRALKESSFVEYNFPKLTGTPREAAAKLVAEADALDGECLIISEKLKALSEERAELDKAADAAMIELDREEGKHALLSTDYAFIMDAWARADRLNEIEAAVSRVTDAYDIEARDPLEDETPPTLIKNSKLVEPYESIVEMYSRPSYKGIDATAAMAPFYFLFFGMMLSDTGYGILLFIGGLLFTKYIRPKGNMGKLVKVITYGGLSAALCGPFIGSFFGMDWDTVFGTANMFPLLFDPMVDVMQMMILSCSLGLIHMFVGIGIKMYMCFRDGDWQSAIFDQLSWMLLLVGLIALFAFPSIKTVALVLIILGGGMLLLFTGRPSKNPVKRLFKGFGALYNITGYLSDILSYVRIFALGLVSGAMGMVFNLIGSLIYNALGGLGVIGIILGVILAAGVLAALHAFSLFINTLGAFAHTARLQFIEFFGKFYEAGGLEFKPLSEKTKNVELRS